MNYLSISKILLASLASLASGYIIYKSGRIYYARRKYKHIPGPETKGLLGFFMGNAYEIYSEIVKGKMFPEFLLEWNQKYGEVYKIQFLDRIIIVTSNTEAIKDILITKNYPKPDLILKQAAFPFDERFLGIGLVTDLNQERWKHRRSLFNSGFHKNVLTTFINDFNSKSDILMERLRTFADGKTIVTIFNEINHATLDAIAQIAFGLNTDSINEKDAHLSNAISNILKILDSSLRDPLTKLKPGKRKEVKFMKECIRSIRKIGKNQILERLNDIKNQNYIPIDILSTILNNWKDHDMDLEAMIDDFVTFFIAGQETTANTLAFCFLELGKKQDKFLKAREEIDRILGKRNEITYQNIVDLKYCSCIFKEALRLYPVVPIIDRYTTDDIEINGYKIPSNTMISLSTFVSSRNEKYFPHPLEFKPERFMKDENSENLIENYTYFPFSLGPRNCIGQNFAQIEGIIVLAKFIQKFDFVLDPNQSFSLLQNITLRPKDGTKCTLTLRS